ncbi:unnamed protein product [Caenorhabditis brenneri]
MENETGFRNRMNESYRKYVEEETKSAEEETRRENEEGVQAVQMEFKVLEMTRKKLEEETKNLKQELAKQNEERLSAAMKSGEKTKDEQKEECLRWEEKLKAIQEELEKIRIKATGQLALIEAGRRDQENSAYCDSANKLRNLFEAVKREIRTQELQLLKALDAMKRGQKLSDKPDIEQVTSTLHELESGIQNFRASNSEFRELQIEVFEKVSELTTFFATINAGIYNYESKVIKTAVDFTEQYKNAKKALLELSKLFLSFNINEESHASKVIFEHLQIAQSRNALMLEGRGSDGQITDGRGQFLLEN